MGKDVHISEDGSLLPKEERTFTRLDLLIEEGMKNISLKEVVPNVCTPLTPSVLHEVITSLKAIMKHNFIPSLLVVAGGIVALHYSSIIQLSGCPTIVAFGPSQTGKTTAIRVALAISGKYVYGVVNSHALNIKIYVYMEAAQHGSILSWVWACSVFAFSFYEFTYLVF